MAPAGTSLLPVGMPPGLLRMYQAVQLASHNCYYCHHSCTAAAETATSMPVDLPQQVKTTAHMSLAHTGCCVGCCPGLRQTQLQPCCLSVTWTARWSVTMPQPQSLGTGGKLRACCAAACLCTTQDGVSRAPVLCDVRRQGVHACFTAPACGNSWYCPCITKSHLALPARRPLPWTCAPLNSSIPPPHVVAAASSLESFKQLLEDKANCLARPDVLISAVGTKVYNRW